MARPIGKVIIYDKRGYAYLPKVLRNEVGVEGKGEIPFYIDANCILLVRKEAQKGDILKGLDLLKHDIDLRWKEEKRGARNNKEVS